MKIFMVLTCHSGLTASGASQTTTRRCESPPLILIRVEILIRDVI